MPENRLKRLAGPSANASQKPSQRGSDHVQVEDHRPGTRPSTGHDDPDLPGGSEQPKNDRRKRGDLDKRGLR
jgi:hypothetical protein